MALEWLASLLTLTAMEIVLGIDNLVFLAILVGKLPAGQQGRARRLGLGLALGTRLLLLLSLSYILGLTQPLFRFSGLGIPERWFYTADGQYLREIDEVSLRDLILLAGGVFLICKATYEIHSKLEAATNKPSVKVGGRFGMTLVQIAILDIVFSLDSVVTAVGMARHLWVMVVAMILAVGVMLVSAGAVSDFIHRHPTLRILALSFLILIGVMLVAEGSGQEINKAYIYFAMAFALAVEFLNLRLRPKAPPVQLHEPAPSADNPARGESA